MNALKSLRISSKMSRPQFAQYFGISYRTVQNWELYGVSPEGRPCPDYLLKLLEYKLVNEGIIVKTVAECKQCKALCGSDETKCPNCGNHLM